MDTGGEAGGGGGATTTAGGSPPGGAAGAADLPAAISPNTNAHSGSPTAATSRQSMSFHHGVPGWGGVAGGRSTGRGATDGMACSGQEDGATECNSCNGWFVGGCARNVSAGRGHTPRASGSQTYLCICSCIRTRHSPEPSSQLTTS